MTTCIPIEIQSNLKGFDQNTYQMTYQGNEKEKQFLTKKRKHDKEDQQILSEEEPYEEIFEKIDKEPESYEKIIMDIFPSFDKQDVFMEEENGLEDLYFIRNINIKKKKKILFNTNYPGIHLFTKAKQDLLEAYLTGINFTERNRSSKKLPHYKHKHYIRVALKRAFINTYLLTALNGKLKRAGFNISFEKFPQEFAINVNRNINKKIMNMTLKEIFKSEEFYTVKDRNNYNHNLNIVDKIEKEGNAELNIILNMKIRCLFNEYLNSEEFAIVEIDRLKNAKIEKDEYYIEKYIYLAQHFIEFCSEKD